MDKTESNIRYNYFFSGFVNSGAIDFTAYAGKNVNVAFKYTSTTSAAATWEIDNVKVIVTK